jgi:hypothetical protein
MDKGCKPPELLRMMYIVFRSITNCILFYPLVLATLKKEDDEEPLWLGCGHYGVQSIRAKG